MIYVRCGWWSSLWQYHISCVRQPSILFTLYVCVHTQHCWCSKEYMFALREGRSLCNQKVSCDAHHPSMILGLPSTKAIMAEQPNYVKNAPPPSPSPIFFRPPLNFRTVHKDRLYSNSCAYFLSVHTLSKDCAAGLTFWRRTELTSRLCTCTDCAAVPTFCISASYKYVYIFHF